MRRSDRSWVRRPILQSWMAVCTHVDRRRSSLTNRLLMMQVQGPFVRTASSVHSRTLHTLYQRSPPAPTLHFGVGLLQQCYTCYYGRFTLIVSVRARGEPQVDRSWVGRRPSISRAAAHESSRSWDPAPTTEAVEFTRSAAQTVRQRLARFARSCPLRVIFARPPGHVSATEVRISSVM